MTPTSDDHRMPAPSPDSPLGGLSPADLLRQGAAEDTLVDGGRPPFVPPSPEELARIFPQFEVLGLIGQGGMGAVYQVRQRELDRVVALKILPPAIGGDAGFADRFAREAKALAKLNHPGIVTIHEFGRGGEFYFIVMEFVDGMNLRELLQRGRISPREALAIVPQVCDALQFAHDHGIVHRDIKPENLLIDRRGRVKVADFGLAKLAGPEPESAAPGSWQGDVFLTEAGKVMGTPDYMAPEQVTSPTEVDHRADIYSLGVVLYQMLTGELPGERLEPPSKKVRLDVRLDEVVLRALEKNPELRFQQASVFKTRVEETTDAPGSSRTSIWFRWGLPLQIAGLLLFLSGLAGALRDSANPSPAIETGRFRSIIAGPQAIEERIKTIVREHGPSASLARNKDATEWTITIRHAEDGVVRDQYRRLEKAVITQMDDALVIEESTSYPSSTPTSRWFRILPGLVLSGVGTGLAGALFLLMKPASGRGRTAGRIALVALLLSVVGPGLLGVVFPAAGLGVKAVLTVAGLGFGMAGRGSKEGRWALVGAWALLFMWGAPLAAMQGKLFPNPESGLVPVQVTANPETTSVEEASPVDHSGKPSSPERVAEAWLRQIDSGDLGRTFAALAHAASSQISEEQWRTAIDGTRTPLGPLATRTLRGEQRLDAAPAGMPAGEYLLLQFGANFEHKKDAVETVILMKAEGEEWKPAGYFIR